MTAVWAKKVFQLNTFLLVCFVNDHTTGNVSVVVRLFRTWVSHINAWFIGGHGHKLVVTFNCDSFIIVLIAFFLLNDLRGLQVLVGIWSCSRERQFG